MHSSICAAFILIAANIECELKNVSICLLNVDRLLKFLHWHTWHKKSCKTIINKKSPANAKAAKGNVQQRCMFESPVKQNLSSPIQANMFLLQLPESTR